MFDKRLAEFVKSEIEPLKQLFAEQVQQKEGSKLISEIQAKVKADGIFDFQKEVLPVLNDFLEKNPDATQPQVKEFFRETYHSESIKRLKAAGKKEEREGKKENLRQNLPAGSGVKPGAMPAKTGDFEKDADNWFAHRGI